MKLIAALLLGLFHQAEPVVSKDSISIHVVRKGNMPLRLILAGSITSIEPAGAIVTADAAASAFLRIGQAVRFEVQIAPRPAGGLPVIPGRVREVQRNAADALQVGIDFDDKLPERTTVGTRVGALVDTGEELRDVVLFERPADAKPHSESTIFVIEAGDEYAKSVTVRYGRQSGAQMEIISGLNPGDRVIVTDMSQWAGQARVRLK